MEVPSDKSPGKVARAPRQTRAGRVGGRSGRTGSPASLSPRRRHLVVLRGNAAGRGFWRGIGGEERNSLVMFSFATGSPTKATTPRTPSPGAE